MKKELKERKVLRRKTEIYQEEIEKRSKNPVLKRRTDYARCYLKNKVSPCVVVYESYMGRGMIDNPYALFLAFIKRSDFAQYEHYWSIERCSEKEISRLREKYIRYSNVHFVQRDSMEYMEVLSRAKYLINNVVFPDYFTKKEEQIYVNTWHGVPIKTLGYDLPGGSVEVRNTLRNFLAADYLVSPNEWMSECYKTCFRLEGIYQGEILEEGQPRNDIQRICNAEDVYAHMETEGILIERDKKIILYAPTWKGDNYGCPDVGLESYFSFIKEVEANVDTSMYQVLVKPHQVVYQYIKESDKVSYQFIPATIDTNELLSVVDVLVTDYSSIYFDFLTLNKPILFYIPDLEEYQEYRGLYEQARELPGPETRELREIGQWIGNIETIKSQYKNQYESIKTWACEKDDGRVSHRVLNRMLEGKQEKAMLVTEKKKILLYAGELSQNGITHSLYSLLKIINYDLFDVTVLTVRHNHNEAAIEAIDKRARVLVQTGTYNATEQEDAQYRYYLEKGKKSNVSWRDVTKRMAKREYRRLFGDTKFDIVIEFNGYSPWYGLLFAYVQGAKKYIWQHNDLHRELERKVDENDSLRKRLSFVFSLYPKYDYIVGCSRSVMEINQKNIKAKGKSKYTYARNTLNIERINRALQEDVFIDVKDESFYIKQVRGEQRGQLSMELLRLPKEDEITFVTMGRLSPEKNYSNLIQGFAKLQQEEPKIKLYVIGDGGLRTSLAQEVKELGMEQHILFTGNLKNPFALMKQADCFILPSNYEGQPLVIQEARALGLPIVMSDFSTGKDVYIKDGQVVVTKDVQGLYEGMKAFLLGKVPKVLFDANAYNQEVYKEVEQLFKE